jgi:hypothetical protein
MIHIRKSSLKQGTNLPDSIVKTNRSHLICIKQHSSKSEPFLNHAESYSTIIKGKDDLSHQLIEFNQKSRFETRPSSIKSSVFCRDFSKNNSNQDILRKRVKFSPQTPMRSRKISISRILNLVKAELPPLPKLEQKAKLYVGLDKNFGLEDSNQYYLKYFGNTNNTLSTKKSAERLKRKQTLLNYIKNSPYQIN